LLAAELASIVHGKAWKSTEGGAEALEEMWAVALLRGRKFPDTTFPDRELEHLSWIAYISSGGCRACQSTPLLPSRSKLIHAGCACVTALLLHA